MVSAISCGSDEKVDGGSGVVFFFWAGSPSSEIMIGRSCSRLWRGDMINITGVYSIRLDLSKSRSLKAFYSNKNKNSKIFDN